MYGWVEFKIRGIYEEKLVGMNSIGNGKKENGKLQVHLKNYSMSYYFILRQIIKV